VLDGFLVLFKFVGEMKKKERKEKKKQIPIGKNNET